MKNKNKILDDVAKMAMGVTGIAAEAKRNGENFIKHQLESFLSEGDFVTREEFEIVKSMATKARLEQENLQKEMNLLKKELAKTLKKQKQ